MKQNKKYAIALILMIFVLGTFAPIFTDPFHQKTESVCFWEWIGKEIWEIFNGEVEPNPNMP